VAAKWWRNKRNKQAMAIKATRRRLRQSYRQQVAREVAAERERLTQLFEQKERGIKALSEDRVQRAEAALAMVSKEVLRLKLEYGPFEFGNRYVMYATMATSLAERSYNLKEMAEVIITQLSHMIVREFKQIDFSRVKPFPPSDYWPRGGYTFKGIEDIRP